MNGGLHAASSRCGTLSLAGRERILTLRGEPLLVADWVDTLMVHLEVDPDALRQVTPFPLDLFESRAFVSLVFFTMRRMRPRLGGRIGAWLMSPLATHEFLNVRTYVKWNEEPGICFLAEWLPNKFSVRLGPMIFGLPYRLGTMNYRHAVNGAGAIEGEARDASTGAAVTYHGRLFTEARFTPCPSSSLDEWLMERYTAFTHHRGISRLFRIWHPPWPQVRAEVEIEDHSLLRSNWPWLTAGSILGANYSPGFRDVWMGRPATLPDRRPR